MEGTFGIKDSVVTYKGNPGDTIDKVANVAKEYMAKFPHCPMVEINFNDTLVVVWPDSNVRDIHAKWQYQRIIARYEHKFGKIDY